MSHDLAEKAKVPIAECEQATLHKTMKEIKKASQQLKEAQKNDLEWRTQWLPDEARENAIINGEEAAKVYDNMIFKLKQGAMNRKLSALTKGPRHGLDYIETPTREWYHSMKEK